MLTFLCLGCLGCAGIPNLDKKLLNTRPPEVLPQAVATNYQVGCPDLLRVVVENRPELSGEVAVGADGRISLGSYEPIRVDGRTPPEIAQLIAHETGSWLGQVHVAVVSYRSQHVVLFGQVIGWQRVVPYHGQETVLDLLQRTGGITRGAAPDDVYVVRTHVEDGRRPEVFLVNLGDIVVKKDQKSNLRLEPYDQVYVGETRQNRLEKVIPPWIRPLYETFWGTRPNSGENNTQPTPPHSRWLPLPKQAAAPTTSSRPQLSATYPQTP